MIAALVTGRQDSAYRRDKAFAIQVGVGAAIAAAAAWIATKSANGWR